MALHQGFAGALWIKVEPLAYGIKAIVDLLPAEYPTQGLFPLAIGAAFHIPNCLSQDGRPEATTDGELPIQHRFRKH